MHRGLGQLREQERFGSWVYRIAEHAIIDNARARARHTVTSAVLEEPAVDRDEDTSDANALLLALTECVALYVAQLPSPHREAVTLTELEGLPHKEAALLLGISLSGLKSRVQRGRRKMRAMFEACCELSIDCRGRVLECRPREASCSAAPDARLQQYQESQMEWLIRSSRPSDLAPVEELLRASMLPLDGVGDHFDAFIVAEVDGQLIGSAGLEIYDDSALLRSVVVHKSARARGIGSQLTLRALERARERNLVDVYLLTTTAEGHFAEHGFQRIDRAQAPPAIRASVEFTSACPASATAMRLHIGR